MTALSFVYRRARRFGLGRLMKRRRSRFETPSHLGTLTFLQTDGNQLKTLKIGPRERSSERQSA